MGLISFLFIPYKTTFSIQTPARDPKYHFLINIDHLKIVNCFFIYLLRFVHYILGDFGQTLFIRSCHDDVILTRKKHNCTGTAFIQGDSEGGSKLIEQTSHRGIKGANLGKCQKCQPA